MSPPAWLSARDCPLLKPGAEADDWARERTQRLLERLLAPAGRDALARAMLDDVAATLRADLAAVYDSPPQWQARWQVLRTTGRPLGEALPRGLLSEVLDREAGSSLPPQAGKPAFLSVCLSYTDRANQVLLAARGREPFTRPELEFAVAAGHYRGAGLERAKAWDERVAALDRCQALVVLSRSLAGEQETIPLLEQIAAEAARLLSAERASIFVWDQPRKELVGRPALGLPHNELRIPEDTGIVGRVLQTGRPCLVDAVDGDSGWSPEVDAHTGFRTRNLLCVPLTDPRGQRLGALEVLNRKDGRFTEEDATTLAALAELAAAALSNVREREALVRANAQHEGQARLAARLVGDSPGLKTLRDTVERVARTDLPVLILGESGTGKEVVARAIHLTSPRHREPFLPVNCAAIAETLLESELFGHEKGAFTDAHAARPGKFELAGGGTLFLDEIGDMSPGGQAKLLRVLEEKTVVRVGGSQAIPVDARIVAATNRALAEAVRAGKFRQDLYYRLSVVTLDLPALRDRREDIPVLADFFLEQFCRDAGRPRLALSADAAARLRDHAWPGNVRELRNLMERVAFLAPGPGVEVSDLVFILPPQPGEAADPFRDLTLADATHAFEAQHITRAIDRARRNMTEAARLLGLHRTNLYRKMKLLGLNPPRE